MPVPEKYQTGRYLLKKLNQHAALVCNRYLRRSAPVAWATGAGLQVRPRLIMAAR